MTTPAYPHPAHLPTLRLRRLGPKLAAAGATLGLAAGTLELALGPHIRTWVGNKNDTTRLGLATIALSAIALASALTWLRQHEPPVATRLLIVLGVLVPAGICFTTAGRSWYLPGALLLLAAASAVAELRHQGAEARATIARTWLPALTTILAALYILLGATALGLAGLLGILGGIAVLALLVSSARLPRRLGPLLLVAAALPFAALTWWSVVTPLLAVLIVAIGWPALRSRGKREGARWMAPDAKATPTRAGRYRLTPARRVSNWLMKGLLRTRLAPRHTYLLEVQGRRTGRRYTTPVRLVEGDGSRWLVAPYGERSWVKNARASGVVELHRGNSHEQLAIRELGPEESAPVLQRYMREVPITRPFFEADPADEVATFRAEAALHPVFALAPTGGHERS